MQGGPIYQKICTPRSLDPGHNVPPPLLAEATLTRAYAPPGTDADRGAHTKHDAPTPHVEPSEQVRNEPAAGLAPCEANLKQ